MRATRLVATATLFFAVAAPTGDAAADSMDPALERLVVNRGCQTTGLSGGVVYDPTSQYTACIPNHAAFAKLVAQYGAALAPTAMHTARTEGFGGFKVALEGSYTTIDSDAHYWKEGTQGGYDENRNQFSTKNVNPDDVLQVYAIKLSKGFPFGVELAGAFGYLVNTNIIAGGADIRMALFEGFRADWPGYIPDLGVGGGVRTITGTSQMKLTVASVDTQLSKPIPISGTVVITPHLGYQWIHIWGDSGLIDFTPNTDAINQCGYLGDNTPATPDPSKDAYDGQPYCSGSSADFNNTRTFQSLEVNRHRINFGAQLRFQMLHFGVHVITDLQSVEDANPETSEAAAPGDATGQTTFALNKFADDPRTEGDDSVGNQWTIAVELGAVF